MGFYNVVGLRVPSRGHSRSFGSYTSKEPRLRRVPEGPRVLVTCLVLGSWRPSKVKFLQSSINTAYKNLKIIFKNGPE